MNREQRRHPPNGVHLLPQMAAQAQVPQGPVFNVGPLMNDMQLVALVAAHRPGPPAEAVDWALDVVAQIVTRMDELARRVAALQAHPPAVG